MEAEHAFMTTQLEQSERLHRFLVEQSPDLIYTVNSRGHFVFVNPRVETLLGFKPRDSSISTTRSWSTKTTWSGRITPSTNGASASVRRSILKSG